MSNVAAGKNTDDEGESLNNVEKVLNKLGIKLRSSTKEWRSFESVLDEVADKWSSFADTERSQIATAIAGTRQQETFAAMMNNWDEVERLTQVAVDSTGTATEKMNIYLESVEAKTNELKSTWEAFVLSLNQSESYKQFLDVCIWVLNNIPTIIDYLKILVLVWASLNSEMLVTKGLKIIDFFKNLTLGAGNLSSSLSLLTSIMQGETTILKANNAELPKAVVEMQAAKAASEGMAGGVTTATAAFSALVTVVTAAAAAIYAGVKVGQMWADTQEKITKQDLENAKNSGEAANSYMNEAQSLQELRNKYEEIINSTQSAKEKKEALISLQSSMDSVLGDEKEKVDLLTQSYKDNTAAIDENIKKKLNKAIQEDENSKETRSNLLGKSHDMTIEGKVATEFEKLEKGVTEGVSDVYKNLYKILKDNGVDLKFQHANGKVSYGSYNATNSQLMNIKNAIDKYSENDLSQDDRKIISDYLSYASPIFGKSLQERTSDKDVTQAYEDNLAALKRKREADFFDEINEYQKMLDKRQELYEKYLETEDETTKKNLYEQLKNQEKDLADYYNKNSGKGFSFLFGEGADKVFSKDQQLGNGMGVNQENSLVKKIDDNDVKKLITSQGYNNIKKVSELMKSGKTDTKEYADAVKYASTSLDFLSDDSEKATKGIEAFKTVLNSFGLDSNKSLLSMIGKYLDVEGDTDNAKNKILTLKDSIKNSLTELNIDTSKNNWFDNLVESLDKGEIKASDFWETLTKYAKRYGVELDKIVQKQDEVSAHKKGYNLDDYKVSNSVDTDANFFKATGAIEDWQGYSDTLKDGGSLKADELDDLAKHSEKIAEKIRSGAKITADDVNELIKDAVDDIDDDLDRMQKIFDKSIDYIDNLVEHSGFGDKFADKVKTAFEEAKEALEDGKDLDFEFNPTVATDTGALTDLAQQIETLEDDYKTGRTSEDDYRAGLFDLYMEMGSASEQAALLNALLAGEGGLAYGFEILNQDQLNALASLMGYESGEALAGDSTQTLQGVLTNLGGRWNELDADQQNTLSSLLNYINTYNNAPATVQDLLAKATGSVKAISYSGSINTGIRKAQVGAAKTPKKSSGSKKGSGSGSSYTPADAKEDIKEILADIEKYEADITADLYDQTEELINHYDLRKNELATLKEELDYYEGIYDSTENTTKWLETQNKLLANQSKSVAAMQKSNAKIEKQREKIYKENKQYNVKGWFDSEGNETLAYGDLINKKERKIESIQEAAAEKMRKQYDKIKNSTDKDTIQKAKDKIKLIKEEAETKAKAVEDEIKKIEQIYEDVDKLNEAWKDNKEAIRDALAEMADRVKDIRDTLVDQLLDTLQRAVDRENTSLENSATRIEQLVSVQEKYNDILNDLYDTQADLDSELQSNLDSYEYLDEQMRQLMFNEEDYKVLSDTISGIQKDITDIWADHYNQISNLTEDEMYKAEYITNETERQLEAKQKEYELAKAELDVAKAQTNLQNVQNERNTRMLINGQWVWTANPDAVKEAKKNLADAQSAKNKVVREQSQQAVIDSMNKLIDADNRQMDKNNYLLEKVEKAIEDQTTEVKTVQEALNNIKTENLPAMSTLIEGAFGKDGKSGYIQELLTNINESSQTLISSLANPTIDEAISSLKSGKLSKKNFESLVEKLGYSFDPTTGKITTQTGSFSASYQGFVKESTKDKQTTTDKETGKQVTSTGNNSKSSSSSNSSSSKSSSGFPKTGKVTTQSANLMLRAKPSTSSTILKKMPKGSKVEVLAETNKSWAQVKYNGKTGYASRQYLTYDQGGLAYGDGVFLKDVNVPERVLSPRQTKAFENLVDNLTVNPVLQALTKSVKGSSNFNQLAPAGMGDKNYYFSNFTVQADNISEFINSLEGMIPISKK